MNQFVNMKREVFRVELRRKQNEDLFKRRRQLALNRDLQQLGKPQNEKESELYWMTFSERDVPPLPQWPGYLDCLVEATSYPNVQKYETLFKNIQSMLAILFEKASSGKEDHPSMLEDALLVLYNLNVHAKRQHELYQLEGETKRILYQLLIIYTSPEVFKVALKVTQTFVEQLEESQTIMEHCLASLADAQDDEIVSIALETINIFMDRSEMLTSTPQLPILRGISFLNSNNYQVKYQILLYYAQVSSFEQNNLNVYVSRDTILTIQKIFLQEQNKDLLIHGLVFLANSCAALEVVDEITKNLVLLNKMKLLFSTQLFPEAWNLCCIMIWSGGLRTTNIFQKLSINQEIMEQFINLKDAYHINQFLEAMIELNDLQHFNQHQFLLKLQDLSINGDADGSEMSSMLLRGIQI